MRQDQAPDSLSWHPRPPCPQATLSARYLSPQHHEVDFGLTHNGESRIVKLRKSEFYHYQLKFYSTKDSFSTNHPEDSAHRVPPALKHGYKP